MKRKVLQLKRGFLHQSFERVTEKKNGQHNLNDWARDLGNVGELGFTIAIPIVGGVVLGAYLDRQFATSPVCTLSFVVLGVIVSFVSIRKLVNRK